MENKTGLLYNLHMALAPHSPTPLSPWTSIVVIFEAKATLGDVANAVDKIRTFRGVRLCDPVSKVSKNPVLVRTYYVQVGAEHDPFNITTRIWNIEICGRKIVESAQITRCADKSLKNRIPGDPS